MKPTRYLLVTAVSFVITAVLLAACGGGAAPAAEEPAAPAVQTLTVIANDIYYGETNDNVENTPTWTIDAGVDLEVTLENNGVLEHNFAIVKPGETVPEPFVVEESGDVILADAGVTAGGESSTATIAALEAGEYQVICTVAGHYPLMQGTLIVE